jgi:dihydrofolate reductase
VGTLVYLMNVSLDGYVETPDRSLDWSKADDEMIRWFSDRSRDAGAFVYGRRLYEVMAAYWPMAESDPAASDAVLDFARIWVPKPKLVVSSTLESVGWNGRLVRGDPVEEVIRLRNDYSGDLHIGGPTLARAFVERGLIDRYDLVVHPAVLGAGTPYFPRLGAPLHLRLVATHAFANGSLYLGYEPDRG